MGRGGDGEVEREWLGGEIGEMEGVVRWREW